MGVNTSDTVPELLHLIVQYYSVPIPWNHVFVWYANTSAKFQILQYSQNYNYRQVNKNLIEVHANVPYAHISMISLPCSSAALLASSSYTAETAVPTPAPSG